MGIAEQHGEHHLGAEVIEAVRIVRSSGGLILDHIGMTLQLARIEWRAETVRLKRMAFAALAGSLLMALALVHVGLLAIVAAWDTPYRMHVAAGITLAYVIAALRARHQLRAAVAAPPGEFAGSIAELHKTIELLRSHL